MVGVGLPVPAGSASSSSSSAGAAPTGFAGSVDGEAANGLTANRMELSKLDILLKVSSILLAWAPPGFAGSTGGGEAAMGLAENRSADANNKISPRNDIDFHLDLPRTLKPFMTTPLANYFPCLSFGKRYGVK